MHVKRSCTLPKNGPTGAEMADLPTAELVALAQAGRREAFGPLYRRYGRRVLTYAVRVCDGEWAMAEDVASEVWARAMECIGRWQPRGHGDDELVRWLFGMVRVQRGQALRSLRMQLPAERRADWTNEDLFAVHEDGADDWAECPNKQELTARLHAAIEQLSPRCRAVVRLRLAGADCAEIRQATGLSGRQVTNAWKLAQADLRRRLAGRIDVNAMSEAERRELRKLAQELPPMTREVALLRLTGMPMAEVAAMTEMSKPQAHGLWRHAQDLLRKLMDDPARARRSQVGRMAAWQKERDRLAASIDLLTAAHREVARLRLAGLTHSEIAERLGRSEGSIGSAWRRALDQFTRLGLLPAA
jgi:RNA polymerase sigma factor (sigma-70 family)